MRHQLLQLQSTIREILEAAHSPQYDGRIAEIRALSEAALSQVNELIEFKDTGFLLNLYRKYWNATETSSVYSKHRVGKGAQG